MEKPNPYLNVYLGPLKEPWERYCEGLGKKPGAALKEAIAAQLAKAEKPAARVYRQKREAIPTEPKHRFEVLLTVSEREALRERANHERCSMRRYTVDAIRASLTQEPQFGMSEIEALGQSNYQLQAIGRNLNQLARRLNADQATAPALPQIEELADQIATHLEKVQGAIRASLERWNVE